MKLISLKCDNCGARLEVNSNLNEVFCNYCGNKMIINDEATTIDRIENAKLKSRKLNHEQQMKEEFDKYEYYRIVRNEKKKEKIKISLVLFVIGLIFLIIGCLAIELSGDDDATFGIFAILSYFPFFAIPFVWMIDSNDNEPPK